MLELLKGQYFGLQDKAIDLDGLLLSQYRYEQRNVDWHYHANPYFMLVLHGGLLDVDKRRTLECDAGTLVFHNQQEPHRNSCHSSGTHGFHLELGEAWLGKNGFNGHLWEGSNAFSDLHMRQLVSQMHHELNILDAESELSIKSLALSLCSLLDISDHDRTKTNVPPKWANRLYELLRDDLSGHDLNSMANSVGVHPSHLSRDFSKYFGCNLGEYVRRVRVIKSADMLRTTALSATEVAFACGFADQSHFIRCFKQFFNATPLQYRRSITSR